MYITTGLSFGEVSPEEEHFLKKKVPRKTLPKKRLALISSMQHAEAGFKTEPAYQAAFAYAAVKAYAAAAEKAGTTDKETIVNALEGLSFEAPAGMITIRKEDHQAEFDAVAGKTASALSVNAGRKAFRNLDPLMVFPAHEVSIPVSETGCNMQ